MRFFFIKYKRKKRCLLQSIFVSLCMKQCKKSSVCSCAFIIISIKKNRQKREAQNRRVSSVRVSGFIIRFSAVKEKIPVKSLSVSIPRMDCIGSVSVEHRKRGKKESASFFIILRFRIGSVVERKHRMVFIFFVFAPKYERKKRFISRIQIFGIGEVQYPVFFSRIDSACKSVIEWKKCAGFKLRVIIVSVNSECLDGIVFLPFLHFIEQIASGIFFASFTSIYLFIFPFIQIVPVRCRNRNNREELNECPEQE